MSSSNVRHNICLCSFWRCLIYFQALFCWLIFPVSSPLFLSGTQCYYCVHWFPLTSAYCFIVFHIKNTFCSLVFVISQREFKKDWNTKFLVTVIIRSLLPTLSYMAELQLPRKLSGKRKRQTPNNGKITGNGSFKSLPKQHK